MKDLGIEYFDVEPLGSGERTWHLFKGRGDAGAQRYAMGMAMLFGGYIKDPDRPIYVYRYDELNGAANQQSLLWVNKTGKRFVNEEVVDNFAEAGNALFTQNEFYTILDQATVDHLQNDSLYKPMGTYDYHDTKLPHLQEEIDDELAKNAKFMIPVGKGPVYAIKQGVGAFCTMGGLKINLDNQVLDQDGAPIKGLYADWWYLRS